MGNALHNIHKSFNVTHGFIAFPHLALHEARGIRHDVNRG